MAWALVVGLSFAGPAAAQQAAKVARVYQGDEVDQLPAMPGATPHRKPVPMPGQFIRYVNTEDLWAAVQQKLVLPAAVRTGQAEGMVSLEFEVTAAGRITKARVQNSLCPTCDTAALIALQKLPRLQPARWQGQPVAVTIVVQVRMVSPDHVYPGDEYRNSLAYCAPGRLSRYLRQQMRLPPEVAAGKVAGRVRVGFIVRRTGQIDSIKVLNALGANCDAEALRLVRAMPAWTPAHDAKGHPIATRQFVDVPLPLPDPAAPYQETERARTYAQKQPALLDGRHNLGGAITREVLYSAAMRRDTLRGYVTLEFVVDANGIVRRPRISKPLRPDFDQAVLEALASLGPLVPAEEYSQPQPFLAQVRVFTTPPPAPTADR